MRRFAVLAGLGSLVLAAGCLPGWKRPDTPPPPPAVTTKMPSAAELVQYMNNNASLVDSVKSTELDMVGKQGNDSIGLSGELYCQKPKNFRLRAKVAGQSAVDIGSNDNEFWFWISQAKDEDGVARVHYCSYQDMAAGKARMPFPFQPDMIVSALGLGEYKPDGQYTVTGDDRTIRLIEKTVSAQGQPVQKVTVFNRTQVAPGKPQVLAYLLLDEQGNEICRATIQEVQTLSVGRDPQTGQPQRVDLPQKVDLVWNAQKIELKMKLMQVQANNIAPQQAARLFSRGDLGYPTTNLAQGADAPPKGVAQDMGLQRAQLLTPTPVK